MMFAEILDAIQREYEINAEQIRAIWRRHIPVSGTPGKDAKKRYSELELRLTLRFLRHYNGGAFRKGTDE